MSALYYMMSRRNASSDDVAAYYDLIRLYNNELIRTTQRLMSKRNGELERVIRREYDRADGRLAIVTFNHDMLAEAALERLSIHQAKPVFCVRQSYSLAKDNAEFYAYDDEPEWTLLDSDSSSCIPVLKLHGSLGWFFRTRDAQPSARLAEDEKKLYVLLSRPMRTEVRFEVGVKTRQFYGWPVIIPPVYDKQVFVKRHLGSVWEAAEAALLAAERVVFFGYSLPDADQHSRHLFERSAKVNERLRRPIVINPDPDVLGHYAKALTTDTMSWFRNGSDYIKAGV